MEGSWGLGNRGDREAKPKLMWAAKRTQVLKLLKLNEGLQISPPKSSKCAGQKQVHHACPRGLHLLWRWESRQGLMPSLGDDSASKASSSQMWGCPDPEERRKSASTWHRNAAVYVKAPSQKASSCPTALPWKRGLDSAKEQKWSYSVEQKERQK